MPVPLRLRSMNRPAAYVSVPLVRSLNGTKRWLGSWPTSFNAVSLSGCPFSVNSSVPARRIFRLAPVDVGISMTVGSWLGLSTAGTLYSGSIGKYASGRNCACRDFGIGSSLARNAASLAARSAASFAAKSRESSGGLLLQAMAPATRAVATHLRKDVASPHDGLVGEAPPQRHRIDRNKFRQASQRREHRSQ